MKIETKTTSKQNKEPVEEKVRQRRILLSLRQVIERTGLSGTTIWRMENRGEFPARVQISENRVGWYEDEIDEFIDSRPRVAVAGEIQE
jgi:prophage regulatory protein